MRTKRHSREIAFLVLMVFSLCLALYPVIFGFITHTGAGRAVELQLGQ